MTECQRLLTNGRNASTVWKVIYKTYKKEMSMTNNTIQDNIFTVERTFNAPRELVFATFSECKHLKHWWGPKGWSLPVCEMDFRVGGTWFYCMNGKDEKGDPMDSCGKAIYDAIEAPERIVYTDTFVDKKGKQLENMPGMQVTTTFEDVDGKTRIISETVFGRKEELDALINMGMEQGVAEEWDKLEAYLGQVIPE